jgi:hypothetical protein
MADSKLRDDATAKARIITHMNADHPDSLRRYLEHYSSLSSFASRNASLKDMTLSSMTIASSSSQTHIIPIDPPLQSWSEARARVVEMDKTATKALGRSDITVTRYQRPVKLWEWGVAIAGTVYLTVFSSRDNFLPGSVPYNLVLKHLPAAVAEFGYKFWPYVYWPTIVIHAVEAVAMAATRLRKHSVPLGSALWWKWIVGTFFEGFANFLRFDVIVAEEKKRKEKARH